MTGANLLGYARWHARDGVVRAIVPCLLFTFLAGMPILFLSREGGLAALREPGSLHDAALRVYAQAMPLAMTLGALMVASGFVALDRERGHVRLLFSAPVSAWRFYLSRYLVAAALFVAGFSLVPLLFGLIVLPVDLLPVIASSALYALLLGSLAMLAGALTRRDGAVVITVALAASMLQGIARDAEVGWITVAARALPPLDAADQVRAAWLSSGTADPGQLLLVLGYGLAMLVASLVVIQRAPLVR